LHCCQGFLYCCFDVDTHHADHLDETLHALLSTLGSGYLGLDVEGYIVESNEAYRRLTGFTDAELLEKNIKDLITVEESSHFAERLKEIQAGRTATFLSRHKKRDGSWIPLEVTVTEVPRNPAFICLYRDLSKEMAALEANRHSIDLLRYVVEHTQSAVAVFDTQMRYLFVSDKYYDEYDLDTEVSIIGKEHYEVIPDIPDRWRDIHNRALAGEVIQEEDDPYLRSSGQTDYTRWECRPWYAQDGTIGGMILYTENITARKRFEEELREARDYLSTLIERASGPIVVWDEAFTVVRVNTAFASLFGLDIEDVIGKHIRSLETYISAAEQPALLALIEQQKRVESVEISIRQSDGSWKVVLWTSSVITDPMTQKVVATMPRVRISPIVSVLSSSTSINLNFWSDGMR
jgi:PAS domain S-box-containing protein